MENKNADTGIAVGSCLLVLLIPVGYAAFWGFVLYLAYLLVRHFVS